MFMKNWNVILLNLVSFFDWVAPAEWFFVFFIIITGSKGFPGAILNVSEMGDADRAHYLRKYMHYFWKSLTKFKGQVKFYTFFSCDQAALWMVQSARLSDYYTLFTMFPSSYHHEIFRGYYQWQKWCPCKRSRSDIKGRGHRGHPSNFKVTRLKKSSILTQIGRFRTETLVWIHQWLRNDAQILK